ncbi:hypothetical protein [Streptomyces sparsus]
MEHHAWWARRAAAGRQQDRERRRKQREEERRRLGGLSTTASADSDTDPVVWCAGVGSAVLAVLLCINLAVFVGSRLPLGDLFQLSGQVRLLFLGLGAAGWLYWAFGFANWSMAAGRSGVWLRDARGTRFVAWDRVQKVVTEADGTVYLNDGDRRWIAGRFRPPVVSRLLRRPSPSRQAADLLTLLSRTPELRPARDSSPADLGPSHRRWVVLLAVALVITSVQLASG